MNFLKLLPIILLSMLMILLSTLKLDQASDLWQLELGSELESHLLWKNAIAVDLRKNHLLKCWG